VSPQLKFGLVVSITDADVGRRVTVRRRCPEGYRDVVGLLESWHDGVLVIRKRDGTPVEVAQDAVVAARVVPPVVRPG
jgi:hypothetical protein